jgi:hypothetical protein
MYNKSFPIKIFLLIKLRMYTVHSVHMYEVCVEYCIFNVYSQEAKCKRASPVRLLIFCSINISC